MLENGYSSYIQWKVRQFILHITASCSEIAYTAYNERQLNAIKTRTVQLTFKSYLKSFSRSIFDFFM